MFDLLAIAGESWLNVPYGSRLMQLRNYEGWIDSEYFTVTNICPPDKTPAEFADEIISQGGEGVVIQRADYVYEPGKRSAWKTVKLKQRLPEMEFKVVASIPATREYNGKYPESWPYWEVEVEHYDPSETDEFGNQWHTPFKEWELIENPSPEERMIGVPVTKPYFYGWHMGVRFEYNGVMCDASSGLTDADREWLGTIEAQQQIKNGELYVTIRAMQEASLGGLRHPVIVRLRTDM
jgi:hypothetical protein